MTKYLRGITYIPSYLIGVFVGLLLGDANISISGKNGNPRISFKQSIINFPFFWTTFCMLSHFCSAMPYLDKTKVRGKIYYSLRFDTRTYPIFYSLYDLFIINERKSISEDLFHYLNPSALAFWIMGDGSRKNKGLLLCTDSFTIQEVVLLMNILIIKYNLKCTLHMSAGLPRIYISPTSMPTLRKIVDPYMVPFSKYKIN
jgi:hypothetical protein